jgi:sugar/nucleoside kinase (ribokinase family)
MKEVLLVGNVGSDFAERFQTEMKQYDIESVNTGRGDLTTGFSLKYDDKGDRTLRVIADAGEIPVRTVWSECENTRYLLFGPVLSEVDMGAAVDLAGSCQGQVFLDPQGLLRRLGADGQVEHFCNRERFKKLAGLVDFIKPNEMEAQVITGLQDHVESAKELVRWGAKVAIVTLGDKGSVAYDGQTCFVVPAYDTTATDPTGAGDVYAGAFLTEYDRTRDLGRSCLYASAAASIMVESVGPDFAVTDESVRHRALNISRRLRTM